MLLVVHTLPGLLLIIYKGINMENFKNVLNTVSLFVGFFLLISGAYHGIWMEDYTRGSFELILALLMKD